MPTRSADSSTPDIPGALAAVNARVAAVARAAGRSPQDITLIAVTKTHGPDIIRAALRSGHRHFGENRVQEAAAKWPDMRAETPDLRLHLIGPLQTNKTRDAVALFDFIHTLDRPNLAEKLAAEMIHQQRRVPCFIQVNTGLEPQKAGVAPNDLDGFVAACRETWQLPVIGLMCIPPVDEEPSLHFAFLRELAKRNGLADLSMGMSGDYEIAADFGATYVRVGSAIFGARG